MKLSCRDRSIERGVTLTGHRHWILFDGTATHFPRPPHIAPNWSVATADLSRSLSFTTILFLTMATFWLKSCSRRGFSCRDVQNEYCKYLFNSYSASHKVPWIKSLSTLDRSHNNSYVGLILWTLHWAPLSDQLVRYTITESFPVLRNCITGPVSLPNYHEK